MKKILIERDNDLIMVNPKDLTRGLCYLNGDEDIYRYNSDYEEMELIADEYIARGSETLYGECSEDEADITVDNRHYKDVSDDACYDCVICDVEHGIRCDRITLENAMGVVCDTTEVDVEIVETISQDYPRQEHVNIYEGVNEDGKRIRIRETVPFFADDSYPNCEVTYI